MATSTSSWIMEDDPLRSAKRTSNKGGEGNENYGLYKKGYNGGRQNPSDRYTDNRSFASQTKFTSSSPSSSPPPQPSTSPPVSSCSQSTPKAPLVATSRQSPMSKSSKISSSSPLSSFHSSGSRAINNQQRNDHGDDGDEIINFRGKRRISFHQRLLALHKSRRQRKRASDRDVSIWYLPPARPSIIDRMDFFYRFGDKEQEALSSFDFLDDELPTSPSGFTLRHLHHHRHTSEDANDNGDIVSNSIPETTSYRLLLKYLQCPPNHTKAVSASNDIEAYDSSLVTEKIYSRQKEVEEQTSFNIVVDGFSPALQLTDDDCR
ncbi:uncharacterized protein LOC141856569 [Brevipalpus obovatus]|uniref:uncharacterized protein LOC141856569 n=1 Tax=Brevipalpus obovatus TaxID=246614 RepID=UPI003D9EADEB